LALTLSEPAAGTVEAAARDAGFLVNAVAPDAVRLAPPLIITTDDAMSFVTALPGILGEAANVLAANVQPGGHA
jgi:acetylornithine/N-succinyldiaminopimelate aminotransferase